MSFKKYVFHLNNPRFLVLINHIDNHQLIKSVLLIQSTGYLSVIGQLDYERKKHHQLVVRATDVFTGSYAETKVNVEVEVSFKYVSNTNLLFCFVLSYVCNLKS